MTEDRSLTEFNLIYGQADSLAKGFPESQFKTAASLLVVIGWLLTASTAQVFIRAIASLALPATIAAMALFVCCKAFWIGGYYTRLQRLHSQLLRLAEARSLSRGTVDAFSVNAVVPVTFFLINVVLCGALTCVVWLICA